MSDDVKEIEDTEPDFDLKPGKKILDEDDADLLGDHAAPILPVDDEVDTDATDVASDLEDDDDTLDFESSDDYDAL